jgi:hypothetical protein
MIVQELVLELFGRRWTDAFVVTVTHSKQPNCRWPRLGLHHFGANLFCNAPVGDGQVLASMAACCKPCPHPRPLDPNTI